MLIIDHASILANSRPQTTAWIAYPNIALWNKSQHKVSPIPIRAVSPLLGQYHSPMTVYQAGRLRSGIVPLFVMILLLAVLEVQHNITSLSACCPEP